MPEYIDLNNLRRQTPEGQPSRSKTKEEQIAELRATISRLEEEAKKPSEYEVFIQLGQEQKEALLYGVNKTLPEGEQYTLEEYERELLDQSKGPNLSSIRLSRVKLQLKALLGE